MPLKPDLGVRLILLLGANLPRPAPAKLMSALESIEVTADNEKGDGVQLVFRQTSDAALLTEPLLAAGNRIIVAVLLGIVPQVLIDGIVTHHESGGGTLTVTGNDLTVELDKEEKDEKYPNQSDSAIAARVLGSYAKLGLIPAVMPTTDVPLEIDRTPGQHETDLALLKRLAQRNGFVFYLEPVTFGVTTAHWGPKLRTGLPQPALTKDMGSATNVTSLEVSVDSLAPVAPGGAFLDPIFKQSIPIPRLPSLKVPPLSTAPVAAVRKERVRDAGSGSPAGAATGLLAAAENAPEAVKATGEVDVAVYGHVLRPRRPVGVRGAGVALDGLYLVDVVTHKLARGSYTQSFRLSREGLGATTPVLGL